MDHLATRVWRDVKGLRCGGWSPRVYTTTHMTVSTGSQSSGGRSFLPLRMIAGSWIEVQDPASIRDCKDAYLQRLISRTWSAYPANSEKWNRLNRLSRLNSQSENDY